MYAFQGSTGFLQELGFLSNRPRVQQPPPFPDLPVDVNDPIHSLMISNDFAYEIQIYILKIVNEK